MIEVSFMGWMLLFLTVFITSCTGLTISSYFSWTDNAKQVGIPYAVGFGLAPFLLGLVIIAALTFLPGRSHLAHLIFTFIVFTPLTFQYFLKTRKYFYNAGSPVYIKLSLWEWIWLLLLVAWIVALLFNIIVIPLTQNDSLEYATVGRIFFNSGTIASYPAIHPA